LAIAAGIACDKWQLLVGEATARTENIGRTEAEQENRLQALRERYGARSRSDAGIDPNPTTLTAADIEAAKLSVVTASRSSRTSADGDRCRSTR
jgi:hypothetical protein